MFRSLMRTSNDPALFLVRLGVGLSLLSHGLEKLGVFTDGGPGLFEAAENSAQRLGQMVGGDTWMGWLAVAAEVLGSLALIAGFMGRFCALCIAGVMGFAAYHAHGLKEGLVEEWWRQTAGSYHLLAVLACLAIVLKGSGWLSVDRALSPSERPFDR
jgi:uncharacterized membrane protein YphA (DoxX/SURF4 family)